MHENTCWMFDNQVFVESPLWWRVIVNQRVSERWSELTVNIRIDHIALDTLHSDVDSECPCSYILSFSLNAVWTSCKWPTSSANERTNDQSIDRSHKSNCIVLNFGMYLRAIFSLAQLTLNKLACWWIFSKYEIQKIFQNNLFDLPRINIQQYS